MTVKFGAIQKHKEYLDSIKAPSDLSTVVLVQGNKFYTQSEAILRVLALLGEPYRSLSAASIIPAPVRNYVYGAVAKYRYKIFGSVDKCREPTKAFRKRFLEYKEEGSPF
eukprot:CAMPEP_0175138830 /NCGR_PEP_ID=MMETSP0087-20121206/10564_1 /TAXON_ID=136419 /ORGANISM="Unknown Unknown, Strain D1" /LENGTH=109 /DNA_ID=CAMNT_0016421771 /DNA_START=182 /DNA_END=511 /DNA_ORIENTATION=+